MCLHSSLSCEDSSLPRILLILSKTRLHQWIYNIFYAHHVGTSITIIAKLRRCITARQPV